MTTRLALTTDTGITAAVTFDRWDALQNERARWRWTFTDTDGTTIAEGDDLTTVGDANPLEALDSLGSFLGAWTEAHNSRYPDSENRDLFPIDPDSGVDWSAVADELTALRPEAR